MKKGTGHIVMMLTLTLIGVSARGQRFVDLRMPGSLCGGTERVVTVGYGSEADVVVSAPLASISHPGTVFLPDGEPCGENGCSYRSPVTFTDFSDTARIRDANDIKYVRLNVEHSFLADLYINITCPNGQEADLLRFGGNNDSECQGAIPSRSVGWQSGGNMGSMAFLGLAYDNENRDELCSPTAVGNEPGVGWNYCWSSNGESGYTYAEGGYIYRSGNTVETEVGLVVDSSDAVGGRNFYRPDDDLSALVGCPMNGTWFIEVVDGYKMDNGYIFDWELALNPELLPVHCTLTERYMKSRYVRRLTDSTFSISVPSEIRRDTVVEIEIGLVNSCGDTVDTTVMLTLHPLYATEERLAECDSVRYGAHLFTADTVVTEHWRTAGGCDSTVRVEVTIIGSHLRAQARIAPMVVTEAQHEVTLTDMSIGAVDREWTVGGMTRGEKEFSYTYPTWTDSVMVELVAYSTTGCTDTLRRWLLMDHSVVEAPNVFTPERENNNCWYLTTRDITAAEVWVYDRQGSLVWHTEEVEGRWDGRDLNGNGCRQGAYVFNALYTTRVHPGRQQRMTGTILLIR